MRPARRFPVGATTVTCTATDAYGNATTHAFTVTVVGPGSPAPQAPTAEPPATGVDVVPPTVDGAAPRLRALGLTRLRRAVRVRFSLSEPATVRIVVRRKGTRKPVEVVTVRARAGKRTVELRLGRLAKGRYTIVVRARDAAGNAAAPQRLRFRQGR